MLSSPTDPTNYAVARPGSGPAQEGWQQALWQEMAEAPRSEEIWCAGFFVAGKEMICTRWEICMSCIIMYNNYIYIYTYICILYIHTYIHIYIYGLYIHRCINSQCGYFDMGWDGFVWKQGLSLKMHQFWSSWHYHVYPTRFLLVYSREKSSQTPGLLASSK